MRYYAVMCILPYKIYSEALLQSVPGWSRVMKIRTLLLVLMLIFALTLVGAACGGEGEQADLDSDGDGWTDYQEQSAGTDPSRVDTDGDGYWDPQDPNPLDSNIPAAESTPAPALTPTPILPPTATPVPTPTCGPTQAGPVEMIPDEILQELAWQFLTENEQVIGTTVYQSTDAKTIFLPFSVHWETPITDTKRLAEEFIRLVKSGVDTPPGIEIGSGKYNYVAYVNEVGGLLIIQGSKRAECDTITWL